MQHLIAWLYLALVATFLVGFLEAANCLPRRATRLALAHLLVAAMSVMVWCCLGRR